MKNLRLKVVPTFLFIELSLFNCVVFQGDNPLVSFLIGELIILLFVADLLKTQYKFHIYQCLLFYFYYSLCITHSFSGFSVQGDVLSVSKWGGRITGSEYYNVSYFVNTVHFVFFVAGYNIIKYKHGILTFYPKQNILIFLCFWLPLLLHMTEVSFIETTDQEYRDIYSASAEEARASINIFKSTFLSIVSEVKMFFVFILTNPLFYGLYQSLAALFRFATSGIKANAFYAFTVILMVYQFYYKKIKIKYITILVPIGISIIIILAGATSFRNNDLSLAGLLSVSEYEFFRSMKYFLINPESSHIIYTADLIERIEKGETTYRYGFDYYRFFLYPFKSFFDSFEYASYVQYASIRAGSMQNAGLYLGLAGELYWNFGIFFFIGSFFMGYALKRFTNFAFSLRPIGVISYLFLMQPMLWAYYRGSGNDVVMTGTIFFVGVNVFLAILQIFNLKFPQVGRKLVKKT